MPKDKPEVISLDDAIIKYGLPPGPEQVCRQIEKKDYNNLNRWSVYGNYRKIKLALQVSGLWNEKIENRLDEEYDSAVESL